MKNLFKTILFAAAAATAFTACVTGDDSVTPGKGGESVYVNLYAGIADEDATRADIEVGDKKFTGAWDDSDKIGVYYATPESNSEYTDFLYSTANKAFGGTLSSATKGNWKYNAFYPHPADTDPDDIKSADATVPFGSGRWQSGNGYNSAFDVMVADAIECADADPGKTYSGEPVEFKMHRLTSILHFALSSTDADVAGAKVKMVKITADKPLAAKTLNFNYDMSGGFAASKADAKLDDASLSNSILLVYTAGTEPSVADFKAFFNILPGNYTLKVEVMTDNNKMATFNVDRSDASKPFVAGKLYTRTESLTGWTTPDFAAPSSVWEGHDWSQRYELVEGLPVKVGVECPAGISRFEIEIDSKILVETGLLEAVGLAAHMDLVNPATEAMADMLKTSLGFPIRDELHNYTSLSLDITSLMYMLYLVVSEDTENTNHDFKLTVVDNLGQSVSHTIQLLHIAKHQMQYADDADLWKNTASFNVTPDSGASNIVVEYKRSSEKAWQQATVTANGDGTYKASIAPTWGTGTNVEGLAILTIDPKTGIFADVEYDLRLMVDGTQTDIITLKTGAGDKIRNAGMEDWTTKTSPDNAKNTVYTPNASSSDLFWANGNNSYMSTLTGGVAAKLCLQGSYSGMGGNACAALSAQNAFSVFAAGNLFTGIFEMSSAVGYARFGQKYDYTARPAALKLKYAANIGKIDKVANNAPATTSDIDKARIIVCIVDWSDRHSVQSGTKIDASTFWNPDKNSSLPEGKIIGYGATYIDASVTDKMIDLELPIVYYEKTDFPPTGNYTLVVLCATSYLGDYLTGRYTNKLWVDDFEWVY